MAGGRKKTKQARGAASPAPEAGRRGWWVAFLVLCVVGAALAADLERMHVRLHTDPGYESFCSINESIDCDTVAASPYSVFLGLPLALWGLIAYLAMGVLAAWGLVRKLPSRSWPWALALVLGLVAAVTGVVLLAVSHFVIGSICIVCAATYLVNFGLAICALRGLGGDGRGARGALAESGRLLAGQALPAIAFGVAVLALTAAVRAQVPPYWRAVTTEGPGGIPVGIGADGRPWIGATAPQLTIVEYSDYECPHCQRGHAQARQLIADNPQAYRLVHRHYPLDDQCNPAFDKPFHRNACAYSRMAWCAQQQGLFWEANDYLFANRGQPITAHGLATAIGADAKRLDACTASAEADREVVDDIAAGRAAGVKGTPTFVIGGQLYPGGIPPQALGPVRPEPADGE